MQKTARRATALASLIVFAASATALAMPLAASAAQVEGVTSVVIQPPNPATPDAPLRDGQTVRVDVTWSVPDSTVAGDTFTLTFPPEIRAFTARFNLVNPSGATVGECVVAAPDFLCTMNDYVLTHNSVSGGLRFYARANGTGESASVDFTTGNGTVIPAALPGGAIVTPGGSAPSGPDKYGYIRSDGSAVEWTVSIPGAATATGGSAIEFTDTWDAALTFQPATLQVGYVAPDDWNNGDYWASVVFLSRGTTADSYAFSDESASSRIRFAFNEPVTDGSRIYVVRYSTAIPADAADGTIYENVVSAPDGQQVAADTVSYLRASGEGAGVVDEQPAPEVIVIDLPTLALPADAPAATGVDLLAETGPDSTPIERVALLLLIVGVAAILLARRKGAVSERP